MFESFSQYDATELSNCGRAFLALLRDHAKHFASDDWEGAAVWTDLVLNWFAGVHAKGVVVDTSAPDTPRDYWSAITDGLPESARKYREGHGEFLKIDLFASRGPGYERHAYWNERYWREMVDSNTSIDPVMALESEWKGGSADMRYACIMHSAIKLCSVTSLAKVLVFATGASKKAIDQRPRWLGDVDTLRRKRNDNAAWLLIDVPHSWNKVKPTGWILEPNAAPAELKLK